MAYSLPLEVWEKADVIHGWLSEPEAALLWEMCTGPWCEVGCWKGKSTVILAQTGHPGWAVDHFVGSSEHAPNTNTLPVFSKMIRPYPNVTVIPSKFEVAYPLVPAGLKLLHLDAEHSYASTKKAWDLYSVKVDRGGTVVIHDGKGGGWPEVEVFVAELRQNQDWYELPGVELSVAFRRR